METRPHIKRLLVVDPSEAFSIMLGKILGANYAIGHVPTIGQGISRLGLGDIDLVLLTWEWPGPSASTTEEREELLKAAAELSVPIPVVALTGDARRETAMEIIKQGAYDFFVQPLDVLELKLVIDHAFRMVSLGRDLVEARGLASITHLGGLIGNSKTMQRVYDLVSKVAGVATTVLLRGESGTGKEVIARSIHRLSPRSAKAFMAFSPSALPETLLEDELFGHEKGAFTGAVQSRRGRFEEAQGGTVFMDEIGDLSLPMQSKLLRVLQERCFERLGSSTPVQADIRLICATNRDLEKMVQEGTFRQDLYFRISVFRIDLPALRDRRDDIPLLAEYFCRHFADLHKKDVHGLTPGFVSALVRHDWPGNVRELQNVIERSLILSDGPQLAVQDLPPEFKTLVVSAPLPSGSFHDALRHFKREMIMGALRVTSGNRLKAARELQISRSYLHRLLKQLDIPDEEAVAEQALWGVKT
ncbi:MAG: sigma-54-dependent Fis family transcriptional regulator [Acidobacteria bacterium]|nr:sigma-54-dependent Fis family transcriptional regulator [Acidobacteriota bacterium]